MCVVVIIRQIIKDRTSVEWTRECIPNLVAHLDGPVFRKLEQLAFDADFSAECFFIDHPTFFQWDGFRPMEGVPDRICENIRGHYHRQHLGRLCGTWRGPRGMAIELNDLLYPAARSFWMRKFCAYMEKARKEHRDGLEDPKGKILAKWMDWLCYSSFYVDCNTPITSHSFNSDDAEDPFRYYCPHCKVRHRHDDQHCKQPK